MGGTLIINITVPGSFGDIVVTGVDQGPSMIITPDTTVHMSFIDRNLCVRYQYSTDGGASWQTNQDIFNGNPSTCIKSHDPALGPDGTTNNVYLYGHGDPTVGNRNLFRAQKIAATGLWGSWQQFVTGSYDCSVSSRWAQYYHNFPGTIDIVFWRDQPEPNTLFYGTIPGP